MLENTTLGNGRQNRKPLVLRTVQIPLVQCDGRISLVPFPVLGFGAEYETMEECTQFDYCTVIEE